MPTQALIEQIFSEVEAVRGLKRKHPVKVEFLDDKAFVAALHDHPKEDPAAREASWIAFGLASPKLDAAPLAQQAIDENILGFYDPRTQRLCVRKKMPKSESGSGRPATSVRFVIAHELEHALQDQNFPGTLGKRDEEEDRALALRALIEGDADATALAVEAKHSGQPLGYRLGLTANAIRSMSLEQLIWRGGFSKKLLGMPPVVRETMLFPYVSGLALVADLYRRGGFKLVDQAFAHPPLSAHQVLHTESYFAGEQPALPPAPAAPPGTRVIETGTLGEVGARVVLETCVAPHVVRTFSEGWRGDRYTLFETPAHALGVVWRSSWSPGQGDGVAKMLRSQQPCWTQLAAGTSATGFTIDALYKARNARDRVALVRGVAKDKLDGAMNDAVDFHPIELPPAPPLGAQLVPRADLKPSIEYDKFTSPRLGLAGAIPDGLDAQEGHAPVELELRGSGVIAMLMLVPERYNPSNVKLFLDTEVLVLTGGNRLALKGEHPIKLAGQTGTQRIWTARGASLSMSVIPACGGAAYEVLVALQHDAAAKRKLDQLASSLQPTGVAGACADLAK